MLNKVVKNRSEQFVLLLLCSSLMLSFQLPVHAAQSILLTWNPSAATNVAGYKIYVGTASGSYATVINAGNTTNAVISGLITGQTNYIAASSYDSAGHESALSAEIVYVVPVVPATLGQAVRTGGNFEFTVSGASGEKYVVQASTDLTSWVSVATNAVPFTFVDTNTTAFSKRFYRSYYLSP